MKQTTYTQLKGFRFKTDDNPQGYYIIADGLDQAKDIFNKQQPGYNVAYATPMAAINPLTLLN